MGFRKRQVHTHNDLKWSPQHQSGLEMMTPLAPDWPGHIIEGLKRPKIVLTGLSVVVWASQGPVWASQGHSLQGPHRVIINMNLSISELHFVLQIPQPP